MLQRGRKVTVAAVDLDAAADSHSAPLSELLSGELQGLHFLLLGNLLGLLLGDELNVSRGGHVGVDAAVSAVGAPSHLRSLVAVHVGDNGLLQVQALGLIRRWSAHRHGNQRNPLVGEGAEGEKSGEREERSTTGVNG